jgi:hypothetical protein
MESTMNSNLGPGPAPSRPAELLLRGLALLLLALLAMPSPTLCLAGELKMATLAGRITTDAGKKDAAGAVVKAVHIFTQKIYTSLPAGSDGRFTMENLPAGYYDVGIDYGGKLFIAASVVNLSEGGKITVDAVLQPYGDKPAEWWQGQKREIPLLGQEQGVAKVTESARAGGKSFWTKPGGIALISIAGAGVIAAAAGGGGGGGGDSHASPSKR